VAKGVKVTFVVFLNAFTLIKRNKNTCSHLGVSATF